MSGSEISSSSTFVILSIASQLKAGALKQRLEHNPLFFKLLFLNFSKRYTNSKT